MHGVSRNRKRRGGTANHRRMAQGKWGLLSYAQSKADLTFGFPFR